MDDLFVRHTYLGAVIGMVVQASLNIDIRRLAEADPADLLQGRELQSATGLSGVLESDFFAWPNEVGGTPLLRTLARRVARFDWAEAPADTAATLYETVIPAEERRQLGEYYTPKWLVRAMIRELVDDPLKQRVLDPSCGSGTFVAEAVTHYITAAKEADRKPWDVLNGLRSAVAGIDVHPVAVHLARAAWTLAARPAIDDARKANRDARLDASLSIPVYLGDALQLGSAPDGMFAQKEVTIQTRDEENTELVFPVSLVERAENFDALMVDVSVSIDEDDEDPLMALDDHHIKDLDERRVIGNAIAAMQRLHDRGRDHIWAYYIRNMVRPVALSRSKVDVVIGNPPWINYNQTADVLRTELVNLSRSPYGIWAGGRYATHQDVAGLFFARSVHLYLEDGGVIGFVLPHSALQAGQYAKWRSGRWRAGKSVPGVQVDFTFKPAWDLEPLEPNSFFPVPASVAFARKLPQEASGKPLAGSVERWEGTPGAYDMRRELVGIADAGANGGLALRRLLPPRRDHSAAPPVLRQRNGEQGHRAGGAHRHRQPAQGQPGQGALEGPGPDPNHRADRRGPASLRCPSGETIAPYVTLEPLKALLPLKRGDAVIPTNADGPGGIRLGGLERRMRGRWQTISRLWEDNKALANNLNLLSQLDYMHKLSSQLEWQQNSDDGQVREWSTPSQVSRPLRCFIESQSSGGPSRLSWIPCRTTDEANYLLAIINSDVLRRAVSPLMSKGQYGARDLHKHLWKLPIPEFDPEQGLHVDINEAPGQQRQPERGRSWRDLARGAGRQAVRDHRAPGAAWVGWSPHRREEPWRESPWVSCWQRSGRSLASVRLVDR